MKLKNINGEDGLNLELAISKNKIEKKFFIVGIGLSAGGLEALKQFFDPMPSDTGIAFIIVQHLDPTHKSILAELIAQHTKMQVIEIKNGNPILPNCVYVLPPNKELRILNNSLELINLNTNRLKRRLIDSFLNSLAKDQKEKAIGIILSGNGSDGSIGLMEIKLEGGMTIVQDPLTAKYSGMPEHAIAVKSADYISSPEKMPEILLKFIKTGKYDLIPKGLTNPNKDQLNSIFQIIRNNTGYDFSNYKISTIVRRISKRIAINQVESIEKYIEFLNNHTDEITNLYKDFLIGVTSFFRDKQVFSSIEKKAIPYLLNKCFEKQKIRVWVCGCSTGEEAYSLAILFNEALKQNKQFMKVIIFASDIDKEAIDFARKGLYAESIADDVSSEFLLKYFTKKENGYELKKEIREMVVFAHHNVIKDPPFSKMDLITCRNLLIYINSDLQKKIIPVFHYSLSNDSMLILGTSESIGEYGYMFSDFDEKNKIFKKKNNFDKKNNNLYALSFTEHNTNLNGVESSSKNIKISNNFGITEKILLDEYAPPTVIIDNNNEALYFYGKTSMYLDLPSGAARMNILDMAKKELKPVLENAIKKVRQSNIETQSEGIEIVINSLITKINVKVKPILDKEYNLGTLMVIFESEKNISNKYILEKNVVKGKQKIVPSELERELKITHEHLKIAMNELEKSKKELQSTNEVYQSSNETLQSTCEELETSREELQSVNEELTTVNTELYYKIEQLSQSNNDLNNLLRSIEVATLFVDKELKIKRFNPAASKIFNIIPSDIDRIVTQLNNNLNYSSLSDDLTHTLKTLTTKSIEVKTIDGVWFNMRIIPYRTIENVIEGVLLTLVDITEQKDVEVKLKANNEFLYLLLKNSPVVVYTCNVASEIVFDFVAANSESVMGYLPEEFIKHNSFWINRMPAADKKKMLKLYSDLQKDGISEIPFKWKGADGKYKQFINHFKCVSAEKNKPTYIIGGWYEKK